MTTLTGPQYYPGASHSGASWYEDNWGGDAMEVNVLDLHTTEGTSLPNYADSSGRVGAVAPNITFVPDFTAKKLKAVQHYRIDISSRALENKLGGVATNTNNVTQAEFVGTCDPATHKKWTAAGYAHIYWPEAPEWALDGMAEYIAWLHKNHGIPLVGPTRGWKAYPASYGTNNGVRMSGAEWNAFRGICGHQHTTENVHGDPGNIPFAKIIAKAKAILKLDDGTTDTGGSTTPKPTIPAFPGTKYFAVGQSNKYVTQLGKQLVKKGFGDFYTVGPGPNWGEADRKNVAAFQRSKAQLRGDADGYPGPLTWKLLFS